MFNITLFIVIDIISSSSSSSRSSSSSSSSSSSRLSFVVNYWLDTIHKTMPFLKLIYLLFATLNPFNCIFYFSKEQILISFTSIKITQIPSGLVWVVYWRFLPRLPISSIKSVIAWHLVTTSYKWRRCSKKKCCKQCGQVKFMGTMTKWPVQKHTEHHKTRSKQGRNRHKEITIFCVSRFFCFLFSIFNYLKDFSRKCWITALVRSISAISPSESKRPEISAPVGDN